MDVTLSVRSVCVCVVGGEGDEQSGNAGGHISRQQLHNEGCAGH